MSFACPGKRQNVFYAKLRHMELLRQRITAAKVNKPAAPGIDIKTGQPLFPAHKARNQQNKIPAAGEIEHAAWVVPGNGQ